MHTCSLWCCPYSQGVESAFMSVSRWMIRNTVLKQQYLVMKAECLIFYRKINGTNNVNCDKRHIFFPFIYGNKYKKVIWKKWHVRYFGSLKSSKFSVKAGVPDLPVCLFCIPRDMCDMRFTSSLESSNAKVQSNVEPRPFLHALALPCAGS